MSAFQVVFVPRDILKMKEQVAAWLQVTVLNFCWVEQQEYGSTYINATVFVFGFPLILSLYYIAIQLNVIS